MKNLVKLMFMALAMCFVACGEFGNGGNDGNGGSDNTPLTFTIGISNITSSTAKVTVTPSNENTYYFDIIDKETIDTYYEGNFENWAKDLVEYITKELGKTMEEYVVSGKDVYIFDSLEASTDYYIFAFGVLNDGTITSNIAYKAFKTLEGSGSGNGGSTGGDKNLTNFAYGYYTNYGDYYEVGATNWYIDLYTADTDDMFVLEVQTATSATTFTGTYQFATTYAAGTAVAFTEDSGSYWGLLDENWENIIDYTPVVSGTAVIGKSGDNYTITVDALDDNGNSIKVAYTGELEEYVDEDYTVSTQRLSNSLNNRFSTASRLIHQKRAKVVSQSAAKAISTKHNLSKMVLGKIRK